MCDCITKVNAQLKPYATELGVNILPRPTLSVRVEISTFIPHSAKIRRGQKPMRMTANYCPFCGQKYEGDTHPLTPPLDKSNP